MHTDKSFFFHLTNFLIDNARQHKTGRLPIQFIQPLSMIFFKKVSLMSNTRDNLSVKDTNHQINQINFIEQTYSYINATVLTQKVRLHIKEPGKKLVYIPAPYYQIALQQHSQKVTDRKQYYWSTNIIRERQE